MKYSMPASASTCGIAQVTEGSSVCEAESTTMPWRFPNLRVIFTDRYSSSGVISPVKKLP